MMSAPIRRSDEENADAVAEMIREFGERILDPWWRINSGALYHIMTKDSPDQPGAVIPFIPNPVQERLLRELHYRNLWLKARQIGGTTLASIAWLDHAQYNADQRCGIVAHDRDSAEAIFRDKVKFAYDRQPEVVKTAFPLATDSQTELLFAHNNSGFRVATSMRSGTVHRLHVSELGKLARDHPLRAREVMEGSLQAVPETGIAIVESTAEGRSGQFYDLATRSEAATAQAKAEKRRLANGEYRFQFVGWFEDRRYRTDPSLVRISATEHAYFDGVEARMGVTLDREQRAFYIAKRDGDFGGNAEAMWKQYPSTPEECWQTTTAGVYYASELALARNQGRITKIPFVSNVPVNTFWDIGNNDGTGIWVHQRIGVRHNLLRYFEGWGLGFAHYVAQLDDMADRLGAPIVWGRHFLPHDAEAFRQGEVAPVSPLTVLQGLKPSWRWEIVPRVRDVGHGIKITREAFGSFWFDEEGCKDGLAHIENYRQAWNSAVGGWTGEPVKDLHTEAADALRQLAQGWTEDGGVAAGSRPKRSGAARRMA